MTRVALDANLLLLLVVGLVDKAYKHKRLKQYHDGGVTFDLLIKVIDGTESILVTPNALTEVSNLLDYGVNEPLRSALWAGFSEFISSSVLEEYLPSVGLLRDREFSQLGLADCAWLGCINCDTILLTDDLPLFLAASSRGLAAFNFTSLRIEAGLLPA